MTQADFFSYAKLYPNKVNVWYSEGSSPYTIYGLSIPVLEQNGDDSTKYLSQVEEVSIPLSGGSVSTINLKVLSRIYGLSSNIGYYILLVSPVEVTSIGSSVVANSSVLLSPSVDSTLFAESPYNALGGSIQDTRQSTYIMQSDRYKIGTLADPTYTGPLNIEQLLSSSATKASIQDSNYSSIGWTRSRYDGTTTNRIDYKVDPALAGRLFQGADFASGSSVQQIDYLLSSSQVDYKDFFYAGKGDVPGFDLSVSTGLTFIANFANPINYPATTGTGLWVTNQNPTTNPRYSPVVGDIIAVNYLTTPELMKISLVRRVGETLPVTYSLNVTRGYYSTSQTINFGTNITRAAPVQIYNIDNNKLSGVPKGLIIVKETGKTLGIDSLGYVISSTI